MENQTQPTTPNSNKNMVIIAVVVIAVVLLGLGGYFIYRAITKSFTETGIEKLIEAQTGQKIDIDKDGKNYKITTEEGEEIEYTFDEEGTVVMKFEGEDQKGEFSFKSDEEGIDIPDTFKKAVPIFDPATMITLNDLGDMGLAGTFSTSKSQQDVKNYYLKELPEQGWEKAGQFEIQDKTTMTFEKGNESLTVMTYNQDDQTHFILSYYKK